MKSRFILIGSIISCTSLLSGCASLNSKFDCPMKPGVMCESLDQVNTQVDQGVLGSSTNTLTCKNCGAGKEISVSTSTDSSAPYSNVMNANAPVRYGETVMRIWMAPYEDKEGNYYQPSVLYTVVKPGYWIGQPVKAISDEGDNA